jgi:hypothetical protein
MLSYLPWSKDYPYENAVKRGFEVYKGDKAHVLKYIMCTYRWSPIVWKEGIRSQINFLQSHYLALDFEDPAISVETIKDRLSDTYYILGSTTHHGLSKKDKPAMDRFRVLIPWDRPIKSLHEYRYNLNHYTIFYGADNQATDGARSFVKCREILAENTSEDTYFETVLDVLPPRVLKKYPYFFGVMPRFSRWALSNEIPHGERSLAVWKMGKELCGCGLAYDDALSRILASPTYAGSVLDLETLRKIKSQLRSGYEVIEGKARR